MPVESLMDLAYGQPDTIRFKTNPSSLNVSWKCDICSSGFQRLDHFKRHTATHKTDRPFMCDFCGSLYKRGDVLRRHWKSCSARIQTGQPVPEPRLGGKEKHACDGCARLKRSCSGGQPCSECQSRGRNCSYERLGGTKSNTLESPPRGWGLSAAGYDTVPAHTPDIGAAGVQQFGEPSRSTWDMGPQNFYASADIIYRAYSRLP
ncbi:hypothetical protein BJX68DRAFT_11431 [Aspergillus pseudodeflectus]|uniref:C2H2 type zinc finger domain protein n=1 Tax=Aspergillus pseudodeflectus TaxID=176178 RepID=A0ABR4LB34_9EURO